TSATPAVINGKITGAFALEIGNGGNTGAFLQINNTSNDFSGGLTVSPGTVRIGANEVIPNGSAAGNLTINADPNSSLDAVLDLNGKTETVNGLFSSVAPGGDINKVKINSSVAGPATLIIGDKNANGSYAGIIQNGTGVVGITKIGTGRQVFSGANTYTGTTAIQNGTLALGS